MKIFFLLSALFFAGLVFGQTTVTISPAPAEALDLVLTPVGMDKPMMVGRVEKTGSGQVNTALDFSKISEADRSNYGITILELLSFCDNSNELFAGNNKIEAYELGPLFLMKNNELAGFITLASDTLLTKWINDPGYEKAVVGSWFELVYISANFAYTGECTQTTNLESGDIETNFQLNLDLKKGLNFIEYKIESVYEGDDEGLSSIAKKVVASAYQAVPKNAKWIAYYY
ncbi:hypothetical protein G3O08_10340 [Cryomorpha ignava]|uniref:Uncharacterized protein n=1 Tax=Cryomorpha ignava TaxID=101383 RepID=A0A7K3WQU7_9FLAO|nr:hypothetical protein [Cryomorpha ignava]NEN23898.1 hypothetical protein [Cryomorpha ignava]